MGWPTDIHVQQFGRNRANDSSTVAVRCLKGHLFSPIALSSHVCVLSTHQSPYCIREPGCLHLQQGPALLQEVQLGQDNGPMQHTSKPSACQTESLVYIVGHCRSGSTGQHGPVVAVRSSVIESAAVRAQQGSFADEGSKMSDHTQQQKFCKAMQPEQERQATNTDLQGASCAVSRNSKFFICCAKPKSTPPV